MSAFTTVTPKKVSKGKKGPKSQKKRSGYSVSKTLATWVQDCPEELRDIITANQAKTDQSFKRRKEFEKFKEQGKGHFCLKGKKGVRNGQVLAHLSKLRAYLSLPEKTWKGKFIPSKKWFLFHNGDLWCRDLTSTQKKIITMLYEGKWEILVKKKKVEEDDQKVEAPTNAFASLGIDEDSEDED
jgi:hypothetical protein